ncbi:delta-60 repeat domain-containing protein [Ahniella affigens]|nr:delta-60 repeat domain-containing protein [Ahniella affigens]
MIRPNQVGAHRVVRTCLFLLFLCSGLGLAQVPAPLAMPNLQLGEAGSIFAMIQQPDGKLVVGGDFTRIAGVSRANLARFNPDGSLDLTFTMAADGIVFCLDIDSQGWIYAGGNFLTLNGQPRSRLGRFNSSGAVDANWQPGTDGTVYDIAFNATQSLLYVVGEFTEVSDVPRERVARVATANGATVDAAWRAGGEADIGVTDVLPDETNGVVYIAGYMEFVDGNVHRGVARLSANGFGSVDNWNPQLNGNVFALEQDGTHVYVGGPFSQVNSAGGLITRQRLARVTKSGALADAAWNPGMTAGDAIIHLRRGTDGLYVAGRFFQVGGQAQAHLARVDATGTGALDQTWRPVVQDPAEFILLDTQEDVFVAEYYEPNVGLNEAGTLSRRSRLAGAASLWTEQIAAENRGVLVSQLQLPDGSSLIGGKFEVINGAIRKNLARLDANGVFDPNFVADTNGSVQSLVLQQGQVVAAGFFTRVNNIVRPGAARLNANTGAVDPGFAPQFDNAVLDVATDAQNRIYATGIFLNVNNVLRAGLARLEPDGSLSPAWLNPLNGVGISLLAEPDGTLMVVGAFTQVAFQPRSRVARITAAGTVDSGFVANAGNTVFSVIRNGSGGYILGGSFRHLNAISRDRLAMVDGTGALLPFQVGANGTVYSTVLLPDQSLVVGGEFSSIGGSNRSRLARLNPATGVVDPVFDPNPDQAVLSLEYRSVDDTVAVAGAFNRMGAMSRIGHAWLPLSPRATPPRPVPVSSPFALLLLGLFVALAPAKWLRRVRQG